MSSAVKKCEHLAALGAAGMLARGIGLTDKATAGIYGSEGGQERGAYGGNYTLPHIFALATSAGCEGRMGKPESNRINSVPTKTSERFR